MNVLVDRMVEQGLIDESTARGVLGLLAKGELLTRALLTSGLAEDVLLRFLSKEFQYPYVELDKCTFSKKFLAQFPARVLLDKHVIPLDEGNGYLFTVMSNPFDTSAIDELRLATGRDFKIALAPSTEIDQCIKQYLGVGADTVQSMISEAGENGFQVIDTDTDGDMDLTEAAEGASIIRFVN